MVLLDLSHCGCALPPDCWGSSGWHMGRYTRETLGASAAQRVRAGDHEGARLILANEASYLGTIFAYEQCPAYLAALRRSGDRQRAVAAAATGRHFE